MAQPTAISVITDNTEYSRYETGHDTVNATISVTGGAPYIAETVVVELVKARRSRDAVVASANASFTGSADPQIASVSFALPDLVDQDMINLVRHGKYFVRARSVATAATLTIGVPSSAPIVLLPMDTGTDTNDWTAEVVIPAGSSDLSVVVIGTDVTINLAVSGGVPIDAQNTREAIVGMILSTQANVLSAYYTGTAGLYLAVAEAQTNFADGRDEVSGDSANFDVRLITVDRLKSDYLFGIPLFAGDMKFIKYQPSSITGVQVTELSKNHPIGLSPLTYNYIVASLTNATVAIGSGANGTVTITATGANEGDAGNSLFVNVLVPGGTSALAVAQVGTSLNVSLDVTSGTPNPGSNTATLITAAINAVTGFTAVASGSGVTAISAAAGPLSFTGGVDKILRQLSWNGGTILDANNPGTYILRRGGAGSGSSKLLAATLGQDYAIVRLAGPTFLPTSSVTEELLVQNRQLDDSTLGKYIDSAVDWVENTALAVYLEPTNVVTDRDPTTIQFAAGINSPNPIFTDPDHDYIVGPLTYFVPTSSEWIGVQTPFMQILRVDSLFGSISSTRVIDIDLDWIQAYPQGGLLQLVPFNQTIAFDFLGLIWVNALRGAAAIPNFWHFNIIAGLRDCPGELMELVAKKAAMDALIMLGAAIRPGIGSVSLGRDGVSQSVSYTTQQQYGAYTGSIMAFKDWMTENLIKLRGKYRGFSMVVV